ncbi:TVP38/TMEM64 family protein [Bacillus pinisoli]|uniref:TVP38/TMEM64 family protein n=1 Tax=Bacillus pinisoli TaxID=2901866 RepID=UPI001FF4C53E|nr:TVP38/TMEM64 family protein [Bacillus pinisoli]
MKNPKGAVKIGIVVVIVMVLIWFNQNYLSIEPQSIRKWILSFGILSPIIYILLYTVRPIVLFPASLLSLSAGLAFGPLWGTVYTIIGATGGAVLAFFISRKLGKSFQKKEWKGRKEVIEKQLTQNGFLYVLLLRLIPLFNFDMISYLSGLSKVKFSHFVIATIIGIIPGTFAYNFLGSSLLASSWWVITIAIILFATVTIVPLLISSTLREKLGFSKNGDQ